jgi:hypothetical protein
MTSFQDPKLSDALSPENVCHIVTSNFMKLKKIWHWDGFKSYQLLWKLVKNHPLYCVQRQRFNSLKSYLQIYNILCLNAEACQKNLKPYSNGHLQFVDYFINFENEYYGCEMI